MILFKKKKKKEKRWAMFVAISLKTKCKKFAFDLDNEKTVSNILCIIAIISHTYNLFLQMTKFCCIFIL